MKKCKQGSGPPSIHRSKPEVVHLKEIFDKWEQRWRTVAVDRPVRSNLAPARKSTFGGQKSRRTPYNAS